MNKLGFIGIVALVLFCACNERMESVAEVTKLRILALQTNPPEIDLHGTDDQIDITALIADPYIPEQHDTDVLGRDVHVLWVALPGLVTPTLDTPLAIPQIYSAPETHQLTLSETEEIERYITDSYTIPLRRDLVDVDQVTVIALICAGGEILLGDTNPQMLPTLMESFESPADLCQGDGAEGILATKTFHVQIHEDDTDVLNENPKISSLEFDGNALRSLLDTDSAPDTDPNYGCYECDNNDGCRGVEVPLNITVFEDSFQQYTDVQFDETSTDRERLYISWFVTGGWFSDSKTGFSDEEDFTSDTKWLPPNPGDFGAYTLFAVVHDVRGGVSWEIFNVAAWAREVTEPGDQCQAE